MNSNNLYQKKLRSEYMRDLARTVFDKELTKWFCGHYGISLGDAENRRKVLKITLSQLSKGQAYKLLRYTHCMSISEIAKYYNVSPSTISRLTKKE